MCGGTGSACYPIVSLAASSMSGETLRVKPEVICHQAKNRQGAGLLSIGGRGGRWGVTGCACQLIRISQTERESDDGFSLKAIVMLNEGRNADGQIRSESREKSVSVSAVMKALTSGHYSHLDMFYTE